MVCRRLNPINVVDAIEFDVPSTLTIRRSRRRPVPPLTNWGWRVVEIVEPVSRRVLEGAGGAPFMVV